MDASSDITPPSGEKFIARQRCLSSSLEKTRLMRIFTASPLQRFPIEELSRLGGLPPERTVETLAQLQSEGARIGVYELDRYFYDPDEAILHPDQVAAHLSTRWWGRRILYGERLTSTIDIAKQLLGEPEAHGTLVLANEQTEGRGRQGSRWISRTGRDLLLTFLIRIGEWEPSPSLMSLFTTTAVARVLDTAYGISISIKWPNDLIMDGCKLGGVLVERDPAHKIFLVSLGLNVHSKPEEWPDELKSSAISLARIQNIAWQRDLLLAQCGTTWEILWETMMRDGGETVRGYWKRYSSTLGRRIRLVHRSRELHGLAKDIDEYGRLVFLTDGQGEIHLLAEEVQSLRVVE